jgi:hypothetical protein
LDTVIVSEPGHATATLHVGVNSTHWLPPVSDGHGGILIHDPPEDSGPPTIDSGKVAEVAKASPQDGSVAASDTFVFRFADAGHATDFHLAAEALPFSSTFANQQVALNAIHDGGQGNTVVTLDGHDPISLAGVVKAQLHTADFHFV